ncbi:uncharacterized protein [Amphiura filiformis]|uniref:uncharacterized protein isoform X1 n=1 Tax=Amphiura filiformis TaxID=82378 RepID=UPI003B218561
MWTNYMDKMYNWIYKMEYIIVLMVLLTFSGTYVLGQQEFEQSSTVVAGNDEQIADYAMDGQTRTCSETQLESDPWWRVRLEQEYHVTAIKITKNARKADELQGAEFRVGSCTAENGLSDNNTLCGTINNQGQAPTITLNCQGSTYGQYLFVNHRGNNKIISLCEVELTTTEVPANQKSMVSFSSASYQVVESAGSLDIEVARSGRTSSCLSVALATSPDSASSGSDFVPTEEVLEFAADEITKTVTITIIPDTMDEGTESFTVKLANIIGGELGDIPEANVQILESLPTTMQATTPNVPTTPVAPTTSPAIPTTASAVPTTSAAVPPTTPALPTTPNIPTTVIATTTGMPTTTALPTTTPNIPTTSPVIATTMVTTPVVPTTAPVVPTTAPAVPTTTPALPTTPNIPTTVIATTTSGMPTTPHIPTTTPNIPTTTPSILTTTPNILTTTPNTPTTTPDIPTTTPNIPTTTPNIPTTTPNIPTTTPNIPTTTPNIPTTTSNAPTTTPTPITTPDIITTTSVNPTTTEQLIETTTIITTPILTTTMNPTTTRFISTPQEFFTTDKANPSTSEAIVVTTSPTTLALTSKSVTTMEQITTPTMHVTTMNNPTTQLTTNVKKTTDRSETTTTLTTQATSEKTHSVEMTSSVLETSSHIVDDFCPMETTIVNGYVLTWPESVANVEVGSVEKCANESSQAGDSLGKRLCLNLDGTGAQWREPTLHSCTYRMDINIQLAEIAKLTITPDNVEEVSSDLAAITSESDDLHSEGLYSLLEILEHIVDNTTYTSVEVAAYVLETVDNIHEVDEDEIREAERGNETISNILVIFETLVERVRENGNNLTYTGEHLSVEIKQLPREAFDDGLTWKPAEDEEGSGNKRDEKEEEATIHIPESVLEFITNETIGVSFVIYDNSLLFQLPHVTKEEGDEDKELRRQIGKVISATVSDTKIVGLPLQDPVVTTFTIPDNTNDRNEVPFDKSLLQCVYWDFAADNGDGDWSTTGCQLVSLEDNNEAVCHCIHLTNFAIILDARGGTHDLVLELISKIGCAISIAALIITILTYLNIRKLRDKQPQRILIHLSFSLLGLYVVFLIGIEQTHWKHGCTAVAGLMHYFTLTSISWMAVEAINMYYVFIQVMNSQVSRFMLKASIFAWGLPLLIVGLIVGLDHTHYVNEHHCFLPPGIVFSFGIVFYIVLVLLFNFVIFFMVMQRLTCGRKSKRTNKKMARETWKRLQNAVTISVLLGLTWIFGFFTIIDSAVFELQLVFCIFNSLQGLFIFLLFCVRPKEVRFAWRAWFSGSTIRRFSMSSYLSNTRKRTSSSGSSGTIRNRLSSGLTGLYRTRDSKGNLTKLNLGEIHHQNDKSVANSLPVVDNDYKRFSTFKEDEHSINEEAKTENETVINDMNVDETLNEENVQVMDDNVQLTQEEDGKEEEVEEEERVSLDSGIPNGTIVEDYDGKETLIVYV